jgi:hypothetical protein
MLVNDELVMKSAVILLISKYKLSIQSKLDSSWESFNATPLEKYKRAHRKPVWGRVAQSYVFDRQQAKIY